MIFSNIYRTNKIFKIEAWDCVKHLMKDAKSKKGDVVRVVGEAAFLLMKTLPFYSDKLKQY